MKRDWKADLPEAEQLRRELKDVKSRQIFWKLLGNTVSSLAVAAAVIVIFSIIFLPAFRVTGTGMEPTLTNSELVVFGRQGKFERGDIIAFYYNNKVLIKRVIAVGGETVEIDENGRVSVDGELLDEPYVGEYALGTCDIEMPLTVPQNRYFVMGDSRGVSVDSRTETVGCVSEELIIGRAVLRVYPFGRFAIL